MAEKVHTLEDVAKHNHKGDCWLLISGKVYDVTPFLEEHPGGDEILVVSAGKDATDDFEDAGHSNDAREKMKEFYIGNIDKSSLPVEQQYVPPAAKKSAQDSGDSSKILLFLPPLLILGIAFFMRFYSKNE